MSLRLACATKTFAAHLWLSALLPRSIHSPNFGKGEGLFELLLADQSPTLELELHGLRGLGAPLAGNSIAATTRPSTRASLARPPVMRG